MDSLVLTSGLSSCGVMVLGHLGSRVCRFNGCGVWVLCSMWDLSSLTRDQTCISCIARWILNHWTTREVPGSGYSGYLYELRNFCFYCSISSFLSTGWVDLHLALPDPGWPPWGAVFPSSELRKGLRAGNNPASSREVERMQIYIFSHPPFLPGKMK